MGGVLQLHPGAAEAGDRAAVADVVDRRDRLGDDPRVAERVRADEQSEADPLGLARPRGQQRVALEEVLVGIAEDRVQVVPRPEMVVPELVDPLRHVEQLGPRGGLAERQDSVARVGHRGGPPGWAWAGHPESTGATVQAPFAATDDRWMRSQTRDTVGTFAAAEQHAPQAPIPRSVRLDASIRSAGANSYGSVARSCSRIWRSSASSIFGSSAAARAFHSSRAASVPGDRARAGHRLVRRAELPVLARVVGLVELDAAAGVVEGRLGPAQDAVHPRHLPLPARQVDRLADLAPVVARRVRRVEHLVVLLRRPVGVLEERPRVVEQPDRQRAARGMVELGGDGRAGHDRVSLRDSGDVMEDALEAQRAGLDPGAVAVEPPLALGRVVDREHLADLVERHLQLAEPGDHVRGLELPIR